MTAAHPHQSPAGKTLAVVGEGLYLLNLLFPLLPLAALSMLAVYQRKRPNSLVRNHLQQALLGAIVTSLLFLSANLLILLLGGYRSLHALIIFEVYYILVVPLSLIPGLIGLLKAMAGETYRYPLLGRYVGS